MGRGIRQWGKLVRRRKKTVRRRKKAVGKKGGGGAVGRNEKWWGVHNYLI